MTTKAAMACAKRTGSAVALDTQALDAAELWKLHVDFVTRVLLQAGVYERDAPDLAQEVFLVVHRRLHEFQGKARVRTWLCRIALNLASEYRRRAYQRRERLELAQDELASDEVPCKLERRELFDQLVAALDLLSEQKREVFLMHELEECSMRHIARQLEVPLKTAFSRLYAARRELADVLRKQGVVLGVAFWWQPRWLRLDRAALLARVPTPWPALALSLVSAFVLMPLSPPSAANPSRSIANPPPMAAGVLTLPSAPMSLELPHSPALSQPRSEPRPAARPTTVAARNPGHRANRIDSAAAPVHDGATTDDEFVVYRTSSGEVQPPVVYPFGFELVQIP